jgi:hypothetical protein
VARLDALSDVVAGSVTSLAVTALVVAALVVAALVVAALAMVSQSCIKSLLAVKFANPISKSESV